MKARTAATICFLLIVFWLLEAMIPFLIVFGIFFYLLLKKEPRIEQKPQKNIPQRRPLPQKEEISRDVIQATLEQVEEMIHNDEMMRKSFDLRQFRGRNNVTKEEVYEFMINQMAWDGVVERSAYMEEICKVSNFTEADSKWVKEQLKSKVQLVRNEEARIVQEYNYEEGRKRIHDYIREHEKYKEFRKTLPPFSQSYQQEIERKDKEFMDNMKRHLKAYDYEGWLKENGYGNNY